MMSYSLFIFELQRLLMMQYTLGEPGGSGPPGERGPSGNYLLHISALGYIFENRFSTDFDSCGRMNRPAWSSRIPRTPGT
jgi:hypothetical protein